MHQIHFLRSECQKEPKGCLTDRGFATGAWPSRVERDLHDLSARKQRVRDFLVTWRGVWSSAKQVGI